MSQLYQIIDIQLAFKNDTSLLQGYQLKYSKARNLGEKSWSALCLSLIEWCLENNKTDILKQLEAKTNIPYNSTINKESFQNFLAVIKYVQQNSSKVEDFYRIISKKQVYIGAQDFLNFFFMNRFQSKIFREDFLQEDIKKLADLFRIKMVVQDNQKKYDIISQHFDQITLVRKSYIWYYLYPDPINTSLQKSMTSKILPLVMQSCQRCRYKYPKEEIQKFPCDHLCCNQCVAVLSQNKTSSQVKCPQPLCSTYLIKKSSQTNYSQQCSYCLKSKPDIILYQPQDTRCREYFCQGCVEIISKSVKGLKCYKCLQSLSQNNFDHLFQQEEHSLPYEQCPKCKTSVQSLKKFPCQHQICQNCFDSFKGICYDEQCQVKEKKKTSSASEKNDYTTNIQLTKDSQRPKQQYKRSCEECKGESILTKTDCDHYFCKECVRKLRLKEQCPICRAKTNFYALDQLNVNGSQEIDKQTNESIIKKVKCQLCFEMQPKDQIYTNPMCKHQWCLYCVMNKKDQINKYKCYIQSCKFDLDNKELSNFYHKSQEANNPQIQPDMNKLKQEKNTSSTLCQLCKQIFPVKKVFVNAECGHTWCFQCIYDKEDQKNSFYCYLDKQRCYKSLDYTSMKMFYESQIDQIIKEQDISEIKQEDKFRCTKCNNEITINIQQNQAIDYVKCSKCSSIHCYSHKNLLTECICFCPQCLRKFDEVDGKYAKICQRCVYYICIGCKVTFKYSSYQDLDKIPDLIDKHQCTKKKKIQEENSHTQMDDEQESIEDVLLEIALQESKQLNSQIIKKSETVQSNDYSIMQANQKSEIFKSQYNGLDPDIVKEIPKSLLKKKDLELQQVLGESRISTKANESQIMKQNKSKNTICIQGCDKYCQCEEELCSRCLCWLQISFQSDCGHKICFQCQQKSGINCMFCEGQIKRSKSPLKKARELRIQHVHQQYDSDYNLSMISSKDEKQDNILRQSNGTFNSSNGTMLNPPYGSQMSQSSSYGIPAYTQQASKTAYRGLSVQKQYVPPRQFVNYRPYGK